MNIGFLRKLLEFYPSDLEVVVRDADGTSQDDITKVFLDGDVKVVVIAFGEPEKTT